MVSLFARQLDIVNAQPDAASFAGSLGQFEQAFQGHADSFMRNSQ